MILTRRQWLAVAAACASARAQAPAPKRLPRKDSFFGIHFDLHPQVSDKALGAAVTEPMTDGFLERVKPDFVQYDCKGHVGVLGYPSEVSLSAPGIVKDSLAIWRTVTKRRGVALYIHFSGVWDDQAVKDHPEWARVDENGQRDPKITSTFGPYARERMIPQLLEVSRKYELDGAWVDGECWATRPDYSPAAIASWKAKGNAEPPPKGPNDAKWAEWLDFQRDQFRSYLRQYLKELHEKRPGFQVASNWMYTTYVPEKPEIPVDFVSGDYLGNASISAARLEARYLSAIGKPWDLMAWGFASAQSNPVGHVHKPAPQLQQEASIVLAQGGAFQIYYQPTREGRINPGHLDVMSQVAAFCRERQQICHRSESASEIAVLFSRHALYSTSNQMFGGWRGHTAPARGALDALIDAQYPVDMLPDWQLPERGSAYKLLVVPDWLDIGADVREQLNEYVENGGALVVIGAENGRSMAQMLGVVYAGIEDQPAFLDATPLMANCKGNWLRAELAEGRQAALRFPTFDNSKDGRIAATIRDIGKGKAIGIYGPVGKVYAQTHNPGIRNWLSGIVDLVYKRKIEIIGSSSVEIVLRRKDSKRYLHLINVAGMQVAADYTAVDFIPPVGPIEIRSGAFKHRVERLAIHESVVLPD